MRPIPPKLRSLLQEMPRMKSCEAKFYDFSCSGPIQWHHVWIYAGRQINEPWAILGACLRHHDMVKTNFQVKEMFERKSLFFANDDDLAKYPRKDWNQIKHYLGVDN